VFMGCISPGPEDPPVDAHNGVIEVDTGFTIKMALHAQKNVDSSADQSDGINPDIFDAGEPDACDTCDDGYEFPPARGGEVVEELVIK